MGETPIAFSVSPWEKTALAPLKKGEIEPFLAPLFKGGWGDQVLSEPYWEWGSGEVGE